MCVLANHGHLTATEALAQKASFECSDRPLKTDSRHLWLLVDVRVVIASIDDPALRLRMSYHDGITIAAVSANMITAQRRYPASELADHVMSPNAMILPIPESSSGTLEAILIGIENVWDAANWRDVAIISQQEAVQAHVRDTTLYALLTGLLITPLVFTALVYSVLRMRFLPYHFGMVACGLIYGLSWSSLIFALPLSLEPIFRAWLNHLTIPLAFMFACLLTRDLGGRKGLSPFWARALEVCGTLPVMSSLIMLSLAPRFGHYGAMVYHAMFILPLAAIVGTLIHGARKKVRIYQLQLLAWSPMVFYVSLRILQGMGLTGPNFITQNGLYPSLITEAILTTGVIAWRIVDIRKQRDQALHQQSVLNDLARSDALTGVMNRRAFIEQFDQTMAANVSSEKTLSLLVLDLDHFKAVNDAHGHAIGDQVLKGLAEVLKNHCREGDICARFGGEEFCLLLNTASVFHADRSANRLKNAIADQVFPVAGQITASFGIVTLHPEFSLPFESWYSAADKALYAAKTSGRNRIQRSIWTPETISADGETYADGWQLKRA